MNVKKLLFGLFLLLFVPSTIMFAAQELSGCNSSHSVIHGSFISFTSDKYNGCGPRDDLSTSDFEINGFWSFYDYDSFKLPEFNKAFDTDYDSNDGTNRFAAYTYMWFAFIGLIAYVILQFFASKKIARLSDIIMLLVGIFCLMEYLEYLDAYGDYKNYENYFYIPLMTIICIVAGMIGIASSKKSEEKK
jgi:hypothetical protein